MVKDGFVVAEKYKARFEELGKASYYSLSFLTSQFPFHP
jgi:hypothetical protein